MLLYECIHVVVAFCAVGLFVVCDIIDFPLLEECGVKYPRRVGDDFVYPSAVTNSLASFGVAHDAARFVTSDIFVAVDADEQVHVWKRELCLSEL